MSEHGEPHDIREGPIPVHTPGGVDGPDPLGYVMVYSDAFARDPPYREKSGVSSRVFLSIRGKIPGHRTDDTLPELADDAYGLTTISIRESKDAADPPYFTRRTGEPRPDGVEVRYEFERANGSARSARVNVSSELDEPVVKTYKHPNVGRDTRYWYEYFQSVDAAVNHIHQHTGLDVSEVSRDE